MRVAGKAAHLLAFTALAAVIVLTVDRVVQPPMTRTLLIALALALLATLPGYLHDYLLPLSLLLIPGALYVLMRVVLPLPPAVEGFDEQTAFYFAELQSGLRAYSVDVFPLSLDAVQGLSLLVTLWVYLLAVAAGVIVLGGRRPLLGAAVLFILMGFTATVTADPLTQGVGLAVILLALLLGTTPWSRPARTLGRSLGAVGIGAVSVLVALAFLTLFPGFARPGWTDWRGFDPFDAGGQAELVFSWKQDYPRLLDPGTRKPLMRVTSPLPSYWRATTLEFFSGDTWLSDGAFRNTLPPGPGPRAVASTEPETIGTPVEQEFTVTGAVTNYLFTGGRPSAVTLDSDVALYSSSSGAVRSATMLSPPLDYAATAVIPRVPPEMLMGTSVDYPAELSEVYLQLPFPDAATARRLAEESDGEALQPGDSGRGAEFVDVYALNEQIVGDATDPYDITLRIERFLRNGYSYTLEVPPSDYVSPISAFLFDTRAGYCQHFAGSMALLLRLNGVPARVAVGFVTGEEVGTWTYQVSTNEAHAWVEAYFTDIGWLPFDPTPGRALPLAGPSSTTPGFVDPFTRVTDPSTNPPTTLSPDAADRLPEDGDTPPTAGGEGSITTRPTTLGPLVLLFVLVAWPLTYQRLRGRGTRVGTPDDRLRASMRLLRGDLAVAGVHVRPSSTLEQLAHSTRDRLGIDLDLVASRVQEVVFGGSPATLSDVRLTERQRTRTRRVARRTRSVRYVASWYGLTPLLDAWWRLTRGDAARAPGRQGTSWRLKP
ncbi:MAG: DUF3488 and transglutaminase-like domain-containing protein [Actinobacteria bacterium]|nr:DUF3488 and transglutaminase-like domain-containing protein [Actinomycetota bacterium]